LLPEGDIVGLTVTNDREEFEYSITDIDRLNAIKEFFDELNLTPGYAEWQIPQNSLYLWLKFSYSDRGNEHIVCFAGDTCLKPYSSNYRFVIEEEQGKKLKELLELEEHVDMDFYRSKDIYDPETIKDEVITNCGLDETWTAYMAVYGYVYGDYMYFYKSAASDRDVYRIGIKNYELKKYKNDVFTPNFIDNYMFYNSLSDNRLYAVNLDTGKKMRLTKNGWSGYVRKYENRIYFADETKGKNRLYVIGTDGSGKRRIASNVSSGYKEPDTMVTVFEGKIYFKTYFTSKEGYVKGTKVYSCNPDGTGKKLMKKLEGIAEADLVIRDQDLLIAYTDYSQKMADIPYEHNMLYQYNGNKFVKLGLADKYPQYDKRQTDGYSYNMDISEYESGGGLIILREDRNGKWETFGRYSDIKWTSVGDFSIKNGYLLSYGANGEEVDRVIVTDMGGKLLLNLQIAGYTDECWMHAAVVGDCVYVIHDNYKYDTVNGEFTLIDKCQKINLV
jgi:hypothetical protein